MHVIRWQPWNDVLSEMGRLQNEMNRAFADGSRAFSVGYPAINLWEDEGKFYLEAELPGFSLEDLEIFINGGNQLTIQGERQAPEIEKGNWHRRERDHGKFARTLELPEDVDANQVEARFKQGMLLIELAKREEVKPKKITIKSE